MHSHINFLYQSCFIYNVTFSVIFSLQIKLSLSSHSVSLSKAVSYVLKHEAGSIYDTSLSNRVHELRCSKYRYKCLPRMKLMMAANMLQYKYRGHTSSSIRGVSAAEHWDRAGVVTADSSCSCVTDTHNHFCHTSIQIVRNAVKAKLSPWLSTKQVRGIGGHKLIYLCIYLGGGRSGFECQQRQDSPLNYIVINSYYIVHKSAHWLIDCTIWLSIQEKKKMYIVQTGSGTLPASYSKGTEVYVPRCKTAGTWNWPLTSI
jgi:hypothetical protein